MRPEKGAIETNVYRKHGGPGLGFKNKTSTSKIQQKNSV